MPRTPLPLLHCDGMVIAPKIDMWSFKRSPIRYGLDAKGLEAKIWRVLAKRQNERNLAEYEGHSES
jgi:hypothetical protein